MAGIKDQKNIEELKKRLYERGVDYVKPERHKLTAQHFDVARGWGGVSESKAPQAVTSPPVANVENQPRATNQPTTPAETVPEVAAKASDSTMTPPPRRRYRAFILLSSLGFFIITALASSIYLILGNNQISAQNINLTLTAPFSLAGGEVVDINVGLANQNNVALQEATLIINYPAGTRSADGQNRDLFEERVPVGRLESQQAINIPLRAVLFGEENQEKEIKVALEYRVVGSDGNFRRDATPHRIRLTSSPLVVQVLSVNRISSGQELEVKIRLSSNANVSQYNILVNTSYPSSFTFTSADPAPDFGQTGWIIREINPEETKEITLRGRVEGLSDEAGEIQVRVGKPRNDNQFVIDSLLSQARTSYIIERPFMDISIAINGDRDGTAIIDPGREAEVQVAVRNSLTEPVFDVRVEIKPEGNLIRDDKLIVNQGLFDRGAGLIRLDVAGDRSLERINAGEARDYSFRVLPDEGQATASFRVSVNVFARRVNEARAAEVLVGSVTAEAKYTSRVTLASQLSHGDGPFNDTGRIPPVAEEATTYTVTLAASAGANDLTNGLVTFNLHQSADWTNQVAGDGSLEFNPVTKQAQWKVGDIRARERKQVQFQVRLTPTREQVGSPVSLIGEQELRATDRFTGVALRSTAPALRSELSLELGFARDNGVVQPRAQ